MDKRLVRPPEDHLQLIRLCVSTAKLSIVTDELRETVERYLPDLKHRLPDKMALDSFGRPVV